MDWTPIAIGVGLGLLRIAQGIAQFVLSVRSTNWPTARGFVVEIGTQRHTVFTPLSRRGFPGIVPRVHYCYSVLGRSYRGRRRCNGENSLWQISRQDAAPELAPYRLYKQVRVHYCPRLPSQSVIEPGWVDGAVLTCLSGLAWGALGLLVGLLWS